MHPLEIGFDEAHKYPVDKVLDVCRAACQSVGGVGVRYPVRIQGHERYLWRERARWFVEAIKQTSDYRKINVRSLWLEIQFGISSFFYFREVKILPYIPFTDEQKRQANLVDLSEFLRRKGEPLIQSGRELRMGSNHSVTIQGNEWYDHATETGGGTVSFLKEFYGMDYQQAVLALLEQDGGSLPQIRAPNEKVKKSFELPPANGDNRRMFAYLVKHRRLDRNVVAQFARQGLLYEDQKYRKRISG